MSALEVLNATTEAELKQAAQRIRTYQEAKGLSDSALVRKFPDLGSTKTYTRILAGDLAELDLERWLNSYSCVLALIESLGDREEIKEAIVETVRGVQELRRSFFETNKETGNARFILIEGDTGEGKSATLRSLTEKFGTRIVPIEATVSWKDNPGALWGAILQARGIREIPSGTVARQDMVFQIFNESRRCLGIDEGHHMGPVCLNAVKSLINQTPGEVVVAALPTLWARLERIAYQEARQLTGNRLADRIRLSLNEADARKMVETWLPTIDRARLKDAVAHMIEHAQRRGAYQFIYETCKRARDGAGKDVVTFEAIVTATRAEVASR